MEMYRYLMATTMNASACNPLPTPQRYFAAALPDHPVADHWKSQ
jgi:hypothetical protein